MASMASGASCGTGIGRAGEALLADRRARRSGGSRSKRKPAHEAVVLAQPAISASTARRSIRRKSPVSWGMSTAAMRDDQAVEELAVASLNARLALRLGPQGVDDLVALAATRATRSGMTSGGSCRSESMTTTASPSRGVDAGGDGDLVAEVAGEAEHLRRADRGRGGQRMASSEPSRLPSSTRISSYGSPRPAHHGGDALRRRCGRVACSL